MMCEILLFIRFSRSFVKIIIAPIRHDAKIILIILVLNVFILKPLRCFFKNVLNSTIWMMNPMLKLIESHPIPYFGARVRESVAIVAILKTFISIGVIVFFFA